MNQRPRNKIEENCCKNLWQGSFHFILFALPTELWPYKIGTAGTDSNRLKPKNEKKLVAVNVFSQDIYSKPFPYKNYTTRDKKIQDTYGIINSDK